MFTENSLTDPREEAFDFSGAEIALTSGVILALLGFISKRRVMFSFGAGMSLSGLIATVVENT